jgi:hypothetical protein
LIFDVLRVTTGDNLLETDNGEVSMELATPLISTRVMLDVNNPLSSVTPYLDPLFISLQIIIPHQFPLLCHRSPCQIDKFNMSVLIELCRELGGSFSKGAPPFVIEAFPRCPIL